MGKTNPGVRSCLRRERPGGAPKALVPHMGLLAW